MDTGRTSYRLESVAWWSLLTTLFLMPPATSNLSSLRFLIPGLGAPLTLDQVGLPTLLVLLVGLATGLITWGLSVSIEGRPVRWHPTWGVLLLFLLLAGVSWVFSVDFSTSLFGSADRRVGFLTMLLYGGAGWLTLQMADSASRVRQLALAVVTAATLQASYGILQTLGFDPTDWGVIPWEADRAFGTLGNPDTFGNYLTFAFPLSVVLALSARSVRFKLVWWTACALISIGLTLSFARGAWLGALAGLVLLGVAALRSGVRPDRHDRVAIGAAIAAALATAVFTLTGMTSYSVLERVLSVFQPDQGSFETRIAIWRSAIDAIAARPLCGWGPDAFNYAWHAHRPATDVAMFGGAHIADDAHSYPLQVAATLGVPAAVAYAAGLGSAFASAMPSAFAVGRPSRLPFAGWFAAAAGYLVTLLVSITSVPATTLLWVAVAVLIAPKARTVTVRPAFERAALAALVAAILAVAVPFSRVVYANYLAGRAAQSPDFDTSQELILRATLFAPWNHNYRLDLADLRLEQVENLVMEIAAASEGDAARLRTVALNELEAARGEYRGAIEEAAYDYWAATGEVNASVVTGELGQPQGFADAVELADTYAPRFPTDAELPLLAAYAQFRRGEIEDARRRFEAVRARYPDLPNVRAVGSEIGAIR